MASQKGPPRSECCNCKTLLGVPAKVLPFTVSEDGGAGGGKAEVFCPQCFVYKRAALDPVRFTPGAYAPIHCTICGLQSVAIGDLKCMQCRRHSVVVLPPKPMS